MIEKYAKGLSLSLSKYKIGKSYPGTCYPGTCIKPRTLKVHHIPTNSIANTVLIINIINNRLKLIVSIFIFFIYNWSFEPIDKKTLPWDIWENSEEL